jgi:hypothetical protein
VLVVDAAKASLMIDVVAVVVVVVVGDNIADIVVDTCMLIAGIF